VPTTTIRSLGTRSTVTFSASTTAPLGIVVRVRTSRVPSGRSSVETISTSFEASRASRAGSLSSA
jgi:hypothetical protein